MNSAPPPECEALNAEAKTFMQRGIPLLASTDEKDLQEALVCFDRALEMRQRLPFEQYGYYRWCLCACWMNRADALTRLGGEERCMEALRSYDVAIAHLHRLPVAMEESRRWRMGVAWVNRGITLKAFGDEKRTVEALNCFDCARQILREHLDSSRLDYQHVLASAWMNRAAVLAASAEAGKLVEACEAARAALNHSRPLEQTDGVMAEVGIKARHALCRSLAFLLEAPEVDRKAADGWIFEATDAVEEVLKLAASWQGNGAVVHRAVLQELFHFGCRIYRAFQPHFLAEFLMEGMEHPERSESMIAAGQEAIQQAAAQIRAEGILPVSQSPEHLDRLLQTLSSLADAAQRLAEAKPSTAGQTEGDPLPEVEG